MSSNYAASHTSFSKELRNNSKHIYVFPLSKNILFSFCEKSDSQETSRLSIEKGYKESGID